MKKKLLFLMTFSLYISDIHSVINLKQLGTHFFKNKITLKKKNNNKVLTSEIKSDEIKSEKEHNTKQFAKYYQMLKHKNMLSEANVIQETIHELMKKHGFHQFEGQQIRYFVTVKPCITAESEEQLQRRIELSSKKLHRQSKRSRSEFLKKPKKNIQKCVSIINLKKIR